MALLKQPGRDGDSSATSAKQQHVRRVLEVSTAVVGVIIGKGGITVRLLQLETGARVVIDVNDTEGAMRTITVSGPEPAVEDCVARIHNLIRVSQTLLMSALLATRAWRLFLSWLQYRPS